MRLDDFVDLFASAGAFRYCCKLCGREMFGESRRKHVARVHAGLLTSDGVVAKRGHWNVQRWLIDSYASDRERRAARRERRRAKIQRELSK